MAMTDIQLYLAIGLPTFAFLMNIMAGILQHNSMMARFAGLETTMNARFTSVENRFTSLEARFDTLTGKVIEFDNRLTRVEAFLERS
jgi:hypothetical protein